MDRAEPVADDGLLPAALREAIREALDGVSLGRLHESAQALSAAYRGVEAPLPRPGDEPFVRLAYVATRLPATYAATVAVLRELRARCPDLSCRSLLDLGAGPATGVWATRRLFGELAQTTLVEPDRSMAELGRRLLGQASPGAHLEIAWRHTGVRPSDHFARHDLVLLSYVAGEIDPGDLEGCVDAAWDACGAALAVIEPGTPQGYRRVLQVRARLVELGAAIVAPCPHQRACPLADHDWCHFAARLNRSAAHRALKAGTLSHEDEKYSYLVATRGAGDRAAARIIRRPVTRRGRIELALCATEGVRQETIARSAGDRYRSARRARWGDAW